MVDYVRVPRNEGPGIDNDSSRQQLPSHVRAGGLSCHVTQRAVIVPVRPSHMACESEANGNAESECENLSNKECFAPWCRCHGCMCQERPNIPLVFTGDSSSELIVCSEPTHYRTYPTRFLMLFLFSCLTATNAMLWITFAPIQSEAKAFYGVGDFPINSLSLVYMIVYIPMGFFAAQVIDRQSLRNGLLMGSAFNFLGALLRMFPYPFISVNKSGSAHFIFFLFAQVGQFFAAVAQAFLLSTPTKLADSWFSPRERVTATSVGVLCNQVGVALGYILPSLLLNGDVTNIPFVMAVEAAICGAVFLCVGVFFKSEPPTHPSASFQHPDKKRLLELSVWNVAVLAMSQRPFRILFVCFGVGVGSFYAITALLSQVLALLDYSTSEVSWLGMVLILVGLLGAILFGMVADWLKVYHRFLTWLALFGTTCGLVWFSVASTQSNNATSLFLCCGFVGFFMTALLPVGLDLCVECTYPLAESITSTVLLMSAQLFGIIFIVTFSFLPATVDAYSIASWAMTGSVCFATLEFLAFRSSHNRQDAERHAQSNETGLDHQSAGFDHGHS